jgi:hypothetical protein
MSFLAAIVARPFRHRYCWLAALIFGVAYLSAIGASRFCGIRTTRLEGRSSLRGTGSSTTVGRPSSSRSIEAVALRKCQEFAELILCDIFTLALVSSQVISPSGFIEGSQHRRPSTRHQDACRLCYDKVLELQERYLLVRGS